MLELRNLSKISVIRFAHTAILKRGEKMNVQFKKGVLELCVLLALDEIECYGYELITKISESIEISEGTIYPLLKRLKDEGYVTTYLEESQVRAFKKIL